MYNKLTNRVRALKSTLGLLSKFTSHVRNSKIGGPKQTQGNGPAITFELSSLRGYDGGKLLCSSRTSHRK